MAPGRLHPHSDECRQRFRKIYNLGILRREATCRVWSPLKRLAYAVLTNGLPGETKPTRCSLAIRRSLSFEVEAAARRLRSFATFSARVRRRRISGRRLGADIEFSLSFQDF